ncbi:MAG TPA: dihydrofolate reductase family protein, partial [Isosphaeraceae bacterium]|nr:dihydrofolate reductase family protein [Isosphaeraceae bacterium]
VQTLITCSLVDEYRLMMFPIILGGGKRLFGESGDAWPLKLASRTLELSSVSGSANVRYLSVPSCMPGTGK